MERLKYNLVCTQIYERIISGSTRIICCPEPHSLEPAFACWDIYVLMKRNRILAKIKSKYWIRTQKYGIEIPKSVNGAKEIDELNQKTLWWDVIMK